MTTRLRLLDGVSWNEVALPGDRVGALLAALVAEHSGVSDGRLVEEIWPDSVPVHPAKALQVLVSRARSATSPGTIRRLDGGYRLGIPDDDVDARAQESALAGARAALADVRRAGVRCRTSARVMRLTARSRRRRMAPEKAEMGLAAASARSNCSSRCAPRSQIVFHI
ncbi:MAG: hypothetical protein JWN97_2758 [Nocardioides sp.]|nr:hypothetical protein [Nocardioides sp.]